MKVKQKLWFSQMGNKDIIGLIIGEDDKGEPKAYLGTARGNNELNDCKHICDTGAKVTKNQVDIITNCFLPKMEGPES